MDLTPEQIKPILDYERERGRKSRGGCSHACLDCRAGKFCLDGLMAKAFNEGCKEGNLNDSV